VGDTVGAADVVAVGRGLDVGAGDAVVIGVENGAGVRVAVLTPVSEMGVTASTVHPARVKIDEIATIATKNFIAAN
jgi:hypothetical protein